MTQFETDAVAFACLGARSAPVSPGALENRQCSSKAAMSRTAKKPVKPKDEDEEEENGEETEAKTAS